MAHTLFIVDNDAGQRDMLCTMLKEKLAYTPVPMPSLSQVVQHILIEQLPKPDALLFDATGFSTTGEMLSNLRLLAGHVPVVALVKFGDYEMALELLGAGAQDFLCKPVATERMGTTLRNVLQLRDARHEVEWLRRSRMQPDSLPPYNGASASHHIPFSLVAEDGNIRRMEEVEAQAIRFAMQFYEGRMTEVARRLGIGRSTLYRKLNDLSIRPSQSEAA